MITNLPDNLYMPLFFRFESILEARVEILTKNGSLFGRFERIN